MIIKHIVELETVINEDSTDSTAQGLLRMPEIVRQELIQELASELIGEMLKQANEGNSWAELRVAK